MLAVVEICITFAIPISTDMTQTINNSAVKVIFNHLQDLNPSGYYRSAADDATIDEVYRGAFQVLHHKMNTLAWKILTGTKGRYSDKQLWVIAFELVKSPEYIESISVTA